MINSIVFDCERMKYQNTGLFHYCLQLGRHLQQQIVSPHEQLSFFLTSKAERYFGCDVSYIDQHSLRKFIMPALGKHQLWHATYQDTRYMPKRHQKIKVVMSVHDLNFMYEKKKEAKRKEYLNRLQNNLDRSSAVICISEYVKTDLLKFCTLKDKPLHVIYNGCNPLRTPHLTDKNYRPVRPFLFAIGVLNRKKNFHVLLPLMKLFPDWELIIAGRKDDVEYFQQLEQNIIHENLEGRVHLLTDIHEEEKAWYYHHCKAMVMPSTAEGFGLPVIEAMSVGKPVFLSNATALPEIGGEAAFYFSDFNAESMKEAIENGLELYETQSRKTTIIEHSKKFSWPRAAAQYLKVYRQVLSAI